MCLSYQALGVFSLTFFKPTTAKCPNRADVTMRISCATLSCVMVLSMRTWGISPRRHKPIEIPPMVFHINFFFSLMGINSICLALTWLAHDHMVFYLDSRPRVLPLFLSRIQVRVLSREIIVQFSVSIPYGNSQII